VPEDSTLMAYLLHKFEIGAHNTEVYHYPTTGPMYLRKYVCTEHRKANS
jgi:hypothetical protein